jgi:hypothetical protein
VTYVSPTCATTRAKGKGREQKGLTAAPIMAKEGFYGTSAQVFPEPSGDASFAAAA